MWINPMLTIWLYGTIFSLALIVTTLWLWYWRDPYDDDADGGRHRQTTVSRETGGSADHAGQ
ncbi:hypothetical protein [Ornithinimicrobium cavernae]|uniref:hypothetical protein n=1 Tax=Ornithinimicrobium cavernae TaxID=2666047 RepID=UPI000D69BCFA|nr:hypothetical protein [Ornithinimicrobium cavernae]